MFSGSAGNTAKAPISLRLLWGNTNSVTGKSPLDGCGSGGHVAATKGAEGAGKSPLELVGIPCEPLPMVDDGEPPGRWPGNRLGTARIGLGQSFQFASV